MNSAIRPPFPNTPMSPDLAPIWDQNMIQKYDTAGPRYTSYPTALQFDTNYGQTQWQRANAAGYTRSEAMSLYLHLPFCDTVCYYCGCNKIITANRRHAEKYLEYVLREIALKSAALAGAGRVKSVHLGGGTPTYFDDDQLARLMRHLYDNFNFRNDVECAIELHPQTVTVKRLEKLGALGFNRASIGIQDFDPEVQRAVNRYNSADEVRVLMAALREFNFVSTSVDLIYGLPHQTAQRFAQTLSTVVDLNPDRISLFNYAHMPSRFKTQRQIDARALPEPQEKLRILHSSIDYLCTEGYAYIGMDHFAKTTDSLYQAQQEGHLQRNFQGYTEHNSEVLHGFGVSSISQLGRDYAQNAKTLAGYYAALDAGQLPIERGIHSSDDDIVRRAVINALLCQLGVNIPALEARFCVSFFDYFAAEIRLLRDYERDGLLKISRDHIRVEATGRLLVRAIAQVFDQYNRIDNSVQEKRFSRII